MSAFGADTGSTLVIFLRRYGIPMNSMRDFIESGEKQGVVKRITAEVDWNLELSHIAKLNEEQQGPALLFENVKGYSSPIITSVCTTPERLALIMGMDRESSLVQIMEHWVNVADRKIEPKLVDTGPCKENILTGDDIDLYKFPAPHWYPMDGGRYFGTAHFIISKDPETGWVNLGTYRSQLLGKDKLGTQFIKGKHADIMLKKYQKMGKPMPVASIVGCDPLLFILGAARISAFVSEYEVAGAIRGEAVEVVKAETVGPAHPGPGRDRGGRPEVDADKFMEEGPFGEYTGYYSGVGTDPRNFIDVKCITHRNNPIMWGTTVGRAVTDTHMTMALSYGAALWQQLVAMKNTGHQIRLLPARGFRPLPGHYLHAADVSRPRRPGPDRGHFHRNGRLRPQDGHRGGRGHRSLGHPPGHVRAVLPVPAESLPGHQTGPVHAPGSVPAHRRPGHNRPAAAGRHHSLRLERQTHPHLPGPRHGRKGQGTLVGIVRGIGPSIHGKRASWRRPALNPAPSGANHQGGESETHPLPAIHGGRVQKRRVLDRGTLLQFL